MQRIERFEYSLRGLLWDLDYDSSSHEIVAEASLTPSQFTSKHIHIVYTDEDVKWSLILKV
jgi:hypothetical protein